MRRAVGSAAHSSPPEEGDCHAAAGALPRRRCRHKLSWGQGAPESIVARGKGANTQRGSGSVNNVNISVGVSLVKGRRAAGSRDAGRGGAGVASEESWGHSRQQPAGTAGAEPMGLMKIPLALAGRVRGLTGCWLSEFLICF